MLCCDVSTPHRNKLGANSATKWMEHTWARAVREPRKLRWSRLTIEDACRVTAQTRMPCVCDYTRAWTAKWAESSISPRQYPLHDRQSSTSLAGRLAHYQNHSPSLELVFLIWSHFLSRLTQYSIRVASASVQLSLLFHAIPNQLHILILSTTKNAAFRCQCTFVSFRRHVSILNTYSTCIFCLQLWLYSSSK
jgi:hypothetical protein